MTTPEAAVTSAALDVAVYYCPSAANYREELVGTLEEVGLPPVSVDPFDQYNAGRAADLALVFGDTVPDIPLDRPTVWVTPDPDVLQAVAERTFGTIHWGTGDDPAVLEARLDAVVDRFTSGAGDSDAASSLYETFVETVGDAVYLLDEEGRFVFVNDALCEMTGYSQSELLGSSVHIIKDEETVEEAEDALRDLLRSRTADGDGIAIAKLDVDLITADGERIPATDRMTLRPLKNGEFAGTVGTLRDISRQRRRQTILSGLVEQSREMMSAVDERSVADLIVETAVDIFDIQIAAVRKYNPETDNLEVIARSADVKEVLGERPTYSPGEGLIGTAYAEGRFVVEPDLPGAVEEAEGLQAGAFCPVGDQYALGLVRASEGFSDVELSLIEVLANTAASAFNRVRREETLRQYEAIVEAADDTLFTLDDEGTFTLVTRAFARLLGRDRSALIGRSLGEFTAEQSPTEAALKADEPVEVTLIGADGEEVPAQLSVAFFEGSAGTGLVGTVRDISQLKSAQREASRQRRRFTELFESLSDPVADIVYEDGVATVDSVNPAFADLCDAAAATVQGGTLVDAQEALPDGFAEALDPVQSPEPALDTSVTVRTDSGERHYLLRTVPYEGDDSDRAFVLLTDVTEVRRRGTHLKVLHRLLRHDLRNRTTLIRGYAEQLQSIDTRPAVDDYAEDIVSAAADLVDTSEISRTVQNVLSMDEDELERVTADTVIDHLRSEFDDVPVEVAASDVTAEVPFSHYLILAVAELVDNAIEHTDTKTVTVEVAAARDGLRLSVSDDGSGLPREQWDLLTGDREITQLQHTNGLGLWLVKWVTDRHNGRLRLDQADADGTTVSLILPDA